MNVIVTPEDLAEVFFDGSVYTVTGTSEDGRRRVTFVGDHGPTGELLRAVRDSGEAQIAYTEDWAVTRSRPTRPCATVGCTAEATEVITYIFRGGDKRETDNVCTPCAESYERLPALRKLTRRPIIQGA